MTHRDPITLEVINNRLGEIVSTMERLLFHSGYSTILRESYYGSAGITNTQGESVLSSGMPTHLPPYYYTVQAVLRRYQPSEMREGDSFLINDPYKAGNLHSPDVAIVTPVFYQGALIAFSTSIAHKPDIGGIVPGSSGAMAREIFHDGMLMPGVRFWTRDGVVSDIEAIVASNCRTPELTIGDLRAQVGCTHVGAEKLKQLCDEYGVTTVLDTFSQLQEGSERRIRAVLREWPDAEVEEQEYLEPDGLDNEGLIRAHVRVVKKGDAITFDFSKSSPQIKGPVNIRPQAVESATMLALVGFLDPSIPLNHGARRAMEFINPEGTLCNPRFPAPVNNYTGIMTIYHGIILRALEAFVPARAFGSPGMGTGALSLGYKGLKTGKAQVQYEVMVTSLGATSANDGTFLSSAMGHSSPSTPIEILETEFPVMVETFEVAPDTGGAGLHRGGMGFRRVYRIEEDETSLTVRFTPFKTRGWGALGGKTPGLGTVTLRSNDGSESPLPMMVTRDLQDGDRVDIVKVGGGGYGNPFERAPEKVRDDLLDGYVTIKGARNDYGVVIDPATKAIDRAATAKLRAEGG